MSEKECVKLLSKGDLNFKPYYYNPERWMFNHRLQPDMLNMSFRLHLVGLITNNETGILETLEPTRLMMARGQLTIYSKMNMSAAPSITRELDSTVHYQKSYDNAFWNGKQMVYGDGDEDLPEGERLFNRFTIAIDIIGHELAHGVTQFEAGLIYIGQSGALNESFSDIFGACVEFFGETDGRGHYPSRSPGTADWLCGEDCWLSSVALRDMRSPRNTSTVGSRNAQPSS